MLSPHEIWQRLGGGPNPPPRLGRYSGAAIAIGGARCVWDDLAATAHIAGDRAAVNEIGMHYPGRLAHWLTLHPEYMPGWLLWRSNHCMGEGARPHTHSHKHAPGIDHAWEAVDVVGGTSGLAIVYVLRMLGYCPVILAGIPMDASGHYFDPPDRKTPEFGDGAVRGEWAQALEMMRGAVFSVSGNTRQWFGGVPENLRRAA